MIKLPPIAIACCVWPTVASAQSTITPGENFGYSANAGWIDFRPSKPDGVVVTETFLAGKAYAANFGWIDLGDGTPANGHAYSNTSASDCGVNLTESGELAGYAYGANVGWITFENKYGKPRLDVTSGRFGGFAYSANVGWIALETQNQLFALSTFMIAYPDTDNDGIGDAYEMLHFSKLATANDTTDSDGDGSSDAREYAANTDPTDSSSYFRITHFLFHPDTPAYTSVDLTFTTVRNRLYSIEHGADLPDASWTDSGLGVFAPHPEDPTTSRSVGFNPGARRFFRVQAHRPLQL